MSTRPRPLGLFVGALALMAGSAAITYWWLRSNAEPRQEPHSLRASADSEAEWLAKLQHSNEEIEILEVEVRRLQGRISELSSERVVVDENDALEDEQADARVTEASKLTVQKSQALSRLRALLPEKYEDYSFEELLLLREIDLGGAVITDETLEYLSSLTNLRDLNLRGAQITDAGLAQLGNQLENLVLRGTGVTGLGLANLRTSNLKALHLCDTHVTAAELYRLPPMPNLQTLKLNFLGLDDSAVNMIGNYPSVRHLELDQSHITDQGLTQLLSLNPNLTRIELRNTKVSFEGAKALSEDYPLCQFVLESGTILGANQ